MNTKIEMLKAAVENLAAKSNVAHEAIEAGVLEVMKRVISESGVSTAYIYEERFDIERPSIFVERDGKREYSGHELSVYFRRDWFKKDEPRKLEINVSACGSFGKDNEELIAYYTLVGYMTRNLSKIEAELKALDWDSYDNACRLHETAMGELELAEREEKAAAYERRVAEFESKLVAGAKVKFGEIADRIKRDENGYPVKDENGRWVFTKRDSIFEVKKVTRKLVFFKETYGQFKKDEIIEKLVKGEYELVG